MNDVPVRMRVLWGAVIVTAGARMTEPQTVDIPLFVEGDKRPEHMPISLMSGTVDEIVSQFRAAVSQAFAKGLEVQKAEQVSFIDTTAIGFHDLTPQEPTSCPPPSPIPPPVQTPPAVDVPAALPVSEVPPATAELAPATPAQPPSFPPSADPADAQVASGTPPAP